MVPGQGPGKRSALSLAPERASSSLPPWEIGPTGSWSSTMQGKAIRSKNEEHAGEKIAEEHRLGRQRRLGGTSHGVGHFDGSVQLHRGCLRSEHGGYPTLGRAAA